MRACAYEKCVFSVHLIVYCSSFVGNLHPKQDMCCFSLHNHIMAKSYAVVLTSQPAASPSSQRHSQWEMRVALKSRLVAPAVVPMELVLELKSTTACRGRPL